MQKVRGSNPCADIFLFSLILFLFPFLFSSPSFPLFSSPFSLLIRTRVLIFLCFGGGGGFCWVRWLLLGFVWVFVVGLWVCWGLLSAWVLLWAGLAFGSFGVGWGFGGRDVRVFDVCVGRVCLCGGWCAGVVLLVFWLALVACRNPRMVHCRARRVRCGHGAQDFLFG